MTVALMLIADAYSDADADVGLARVAQPGQARRSAPAASTTPA